MQSGRITRYGWSTGARLALLLAIALSVLAVGPASVPALLSGDPSYERSRSAEDRSAGLLRAAIEASADGRREDASLLFEQAAELQLVGDHIAVLWARAALEADDPDQAVVVCLRALQAYPDSPLRSDLRQLLGLVRMRFGDEEGARSAWHSALREATDAESKAALWQLIAQSKERSGDREAAAEAYLELWQAFPTHAEAAGAGERLEAMAAESSIAAPGAEAWRRRADGLFRARHNLEALAAYDRARAMGLDQSQLLRVGARRAQALFRLRRYPEAVEAFSSLPQTGDTPIWRARSLARAGEVMRSIDEFERIAERDRGDLGLRAIYLAGLLLEGRDRKVAAKAHFERLASSPGAELATAAIWRLAWADYGAGHYAAARERLAQLMEKEVDALSALRSRYWHARATEALGLEPSEAGPDSEPRKSEASRAFAAIAREFPFSYYGLRARERVGAEAVAHEPLTLGSPPLGTEGLAGADLARARVLVLAGLETEARDELDRLRRSARGLRDRLALAQLYADASDYHGAQGVVVDAYSEYLARGPQPGLEALWWHAWPLAFPTAVDAATARPGAVDRVLVYAIMREESSYRPGVMSVSGARGLMQIMIPTAERLARELELDNFEPDDLFDAGTNIKLGAHYLAKLSSIFPSQEAAAIASYNAGSSAVKAWLGGGRAVDDGWIEAIPYEQTRHYVKRVLRSRHVYGVLY